MGFIILWLRIVQILDSFLFDIIAAFNQSEQGFKSDLISGNSVKPK